MIFGTGPGPRKLFLYLFVDILGNVIYLTSGKCHQLSRILYIDIYKPSTLMTTIMYQLPRFSNFQTNYTPPYSQTQEKVEISCDVNKIGMNFPTKRKLVPGFTRPVALQDASREPWAPAAPYGMVVVEEKHMRNTSFRFQKL